MKGDENRFFCLLAYDLSNNKRRLKLSKLLESLGLRVQGSVFEGWLTEKELKELRRKAKDLIVDPRESLRIYPLCRSCFDKMILVGQGLKASEPETVVL